MGRYGEGDETIRIFTEGEPFGSFGSLSIHHSEGLLPSLHLFRSPPEWQSKRSEGSWEPPFRLHAPPFGVVLGPR